MCPEPSALLDDEEVVEIGFWLEWSTFGDGKLIGRFACPVGEETP